MKILCVFGKYNYGDPARGLGYEYCNFIPALKRLGHQVVFFDSKDRRLFPDFVALNRALIETVIREQPDLVLSVQMLYEVWLETWCLIRTVSPAILINWTTDDSWRYESFSRHIASAFHLITTTYPEALRKYHRDGLHNVFLTQWAANAENLQPPLPASRCKYPVTFIGTAHGNRKQVIGSLMQQGVPVKCFGFGWDAGSIESERIPKIIRESVISLNFANSSWVWENGLFPRSHKQIKARVFEVPGAGGFLLTENAPGLENFYQVGSEIDVFNNVYELTKKIRYYLSCPSERDAIATAGFQRTIREHTYDRRLGELIETAVKQFSRTTNVENTQDWQARFTTIEQMHYPSIWQKCFRDSLVFLCTLFWGKTRGPRAARRLTFEISWRLCGEKTYSASGIPGKLFYKES